MEIGIQVVTQSARGQEDFVVNILGDRFTVNTVWASSDSDVKRWVRMIQKTHRQKLRRRKLIVALSADRSFNYANGRNFWGKKGKSLKDEPYELLEICVENDVLLCHLNAESCSWGEKWFPKALKDLLNDNGVTVVGVGIGEFSRKMGKDYGWIMTNKVVELRDLAMAAQSKKNDTTDFGRFGVAKLARAVLGDEVDLVKPTKISWWDPQRSTWPPQEGGLTVVMIKYATVEVFLAWLMGATLLANAT